MSFNLTAKIKRVLNKGNLYNLATNPSKFFNSFKYQLNNGLTSATNSLLDNHLLHIASFTTKNAGDTLLPLVLRDLISSRIPGINWKAEHVHNRVSKKSLSYFNKFRGIFVGGGGLFISDTNANNISGWQWPISEESIRTLLPPIIVFAVGFNKFRGQTDFSSNFKNTVNALVEKSTFFGLRNKGSVAAISDYLIPENISKVAYQPCMTTIIKNIYPHQFEDQIIPEDPIVVLNCAFDRSDNRFGVNKHQILKAIAMAMKNISKFAIVFYYSHTRQDKQILSYLDACNLKYQHFELYDMPPQVVLNAYKNVNLAIGMRGHSQMIPFGCNIPIISLISHDKLRWFLEDIDMEDYGIDVNSMDIDLQITRKASMILSNQERERNLVSTKINDCAQITFDNINSFSHLFL